MEDKKSYKIGVMTHWWTQTNYGQVLQAYALQMFLRSNGHEAFLVKYDIHKAIKFENLSLNNLLSKLFILNSWKGLILKWFNRIQFWKKIKNANFDKTHPRHFDDFKSKFLKYSDITYSNLEELRLSPPNADVLIVGSDQVWMLPNQIKPYFLDFGDNNLKRIAYAASFGRNFLTKEEISIGPKLLQRFTAVGVREVTGIDLCKQLGVDNAVLVPDPTIFLSRDEWLKIAEDSDYFKVNEKKIFVYMIGNEDNSKIHKTAYYINKDKNTVYVSSDGYDTKSNAFPTIGQWIGLINAADFVITNSFHGTIFSLLFNKDFITMTRDGMSSKMNVRTKSILEKFDIVHRLLESYDPQTIENAIRNEINWDKINQEMQTFKSIGIDFLINAFKGNIIKS